jgi:putative hemolysin
MLPADATPERLRALIRDRDYSRFPVYEGEPSRVIGLVHAMDVLTRPDADQATLPSLLKPIARLSPRMSVAEALFELQRRHQAMGVVTDEADRATGIVTVKDLVEEVVGKLEAW